MRGILEATSLRNPIETERVTNHYKRSDALAHQCPYEDAVWLDQALEMESFRQWREEESIEDC